MIGNLLTLITAVGAFALVAAAVERLLPRRVPVPVRVARAHEGEAGRDAR